MANIRAAPTRAGSRRTAYTGDHSLVSPESSSCFVLRDFPFAIVPPLARPKIQDCRPRDHVGMVGEVFAVVFFDHRDRRVVHHGDDPDGYAAQDLADDTRVPERIHRDAAVALVRSLEKSIARECSLCGVHERRIIARLAPPIG